MSKSQYIIPQTNQIYLREEYIRESYRVMPNNVTITITDKKHQRILTQHRVRYYRDGFGIMMDRLVTRLQYHPGGQIKSIRELHRVGRMDGSGKATRKMIKVTYCERGKLTSYKDHKGNEWKREWGVEYPYANIEKWVWCWRYNTGGRVPQTMEERYTPMEIYAYRYGASLLPKQGMYQSQADNLVRGHQHQWLDSPLKTLE